MKSSGFDLRREEKKKIRAHFDSNFLLKAKVNKSYLIDQTVARARNKDHCLRVMSLLEI